MPPLPSLDEKCGENFRYKDIVECGETFLELRPNNVPREKKTYEALRELAQSVLDPLWDKFGDIKLTYGLSCRDLHQHIKARISPPLDQHASYELNTRGKQICARGGAAVDLYCPGVSSLKAAQWIVKNCPFDRLYFYGSENPIHVSIGPEQNRQVILMRQSTTADRRVPRKVSVEGFIMLKKEDDLIMSCVATKGSNS
jgi:hypothetical protein